MRNNLEIHVEVGFLALRAVISLGCLSGEIVFFRLVAEKVHLSPLVVVVLGPILPQLLSLVLSRLSGKAGLK